MALEAGRVRRADDLLRMGTPAQRRGPVDLRARAWYAKALLDLSAGRRRAALVALRTGVHLVEEHQATLGAADLRTSASAYRTELVDLGLQLALEGGRARHVLAWAERGRATALLMRSVRPPGDPVLAQLLVELRATVHEAEEGRADAAARAGSARRQAALERAVRDHVRAARRSAGGADRPGLEQVAEALGDEALVEFVDHRGQLFAVTVVDRRLRLTRLGTSATVVGLTEHVPFALRRLSRRAGRALRDVRDAAALEVLRSSALRLDELLLRPLLPQLDDRPLVVVPAGCLQSVSWSVLPSCVGRPVTVAPSAALWHRASTAPARDGGVLVAAGPGLPAAPGEAAAVAALYPGARLLVGAAASVYAVEQELGRSTIAHLAAHGHFRADNPLFSALQLHDGPLTVYDLDGLSDAPRLVVLAACDAGSTAVRAGNELLGLAAGFLTQGTVALIAPVGPVCDADVAALMVDLHARLCAGTAPATALARTQREAAGGAPGTVAAAAGLLCLGAGNARHVLGSVSPPDDRPARRGVGLVAARS
jgi:CHAT domain